MSIQAVAWALEQEDIPARPKLVLVAIANHANHTDGYCWLKAETIAREASCTTRGLYNFIGALVRNGFLRKSLRKGDDGKQRATDYWLLFDREENPWDNEANVEPDAAESEADDSDTIVDQPQDIVSPPEHRAAGEINATPPTEAVDIPPHSGGPAESAFHRKRIAEPSKTNPKKTEPSPAVAAALRSYRPPPPQPLGATVEQPKPQIFVYVGTRAWDAWVAHHKRKTGIAWSLTRTASVDGKWKNGWWFPSLFPPDDQGSDVGATGPPSTSAA